MTERQFIFCLSSSLAGSVLSLLFGQLRGIFAALLIMMVLDYITGVLNGIKSKNLSSEISYWGLVKKLVILIIIIVANVVDKWIFGSEMCRNVVICFYIANEGLSILENAIKLGVPAPEKLKAILSQLKEDTHDYMG